MLLMPQGGEFMEPILDFISQVPDDILKSTKVCPCSNVVLFKPMAYIGGTSFRVTDYHVVIPSEDTPEALFNSKMMHIEPRSILTVNPGDQVVCFTNASAKPYYSLLIHPDFLHKIAEEMDFSGEVRFENLLNPFSFTLYQLLEKLECEYVRPDKMNLLIDSLEIQIAALLLREYKTNVARPIDSSEDISSYISMAIEYMYENLNSNLFLEDICREIHVSRFHFIRMFTRETGLTPHKYLLMLRIEKAKELLETNKYSVMETAELCGFESVSHFSVTFKKVTGFSPASFKSY
jgi:AraC-like DNA-binding protein